MSRYKILLVMIFSMLLGNSVVLAADFDKGVRAAQAGDYETALAEWVPLAEQGGSAAQYNLGIMYKSGLGVTESDRTAVKWFAKAAEQGDAEAQFMLAHMYSLGKGVPENDQAAMKWFAKSAEQGHGDAQAKLGLMYASGIGDAVRGYMWYNLGAYNGSELADVQKAILGDFLTSSQIAKAQEMSSRCLESGYTDC